MINLQTRSCAEQIFLSEVQSATLPQSAGVKVTPSPFVRYAPHNLDDLSERAWRATLALDFAMMASNVYTPDVDAVRFDPKHPDLKAPMVELCDWTMSQDVSCKETSEQAASGLAWRVWVRTHNKPWEDDLDNVVRIALVFRGTESAMDWYSNMFWLTHWFPPKTQYDFVHEVVQSIIDRYTSQYAGQGKELRFYTAGHSLGGGLAQCAIYHFPEQIRRAFAFDPSPVTAYYTVAADVRKKIRNVSKATSHRPDVRIFRIYESGEVLAFVRRFFSWVYPVDNFIQEIRFNFMKTKDAIFQHKMRPFAGHLLLASRDARGIAKMK